MHFDQEGFEIVGDMADIEVIAIRSAIRGIRQIEKLFGRGRWRKLKGTAIARLENGQLRRVELHWYEAHGIGRRKLKIKIALENG